MLEEIHSNYISENNKFYLYKLSKTIWEKKIYQDLQYPLPSVVKNNLQSLYEEWRKKTDPSLRLENRWLQGSVVLSFQQTDYIMTPIQAIVLLILEIPSTYLDIIEKLQIPDDRHHNLNGVLESLFRIRLIKQQNEQQWCWDLSKKSKTYSKIYVPPVNQRNKQTTLHEKKSLEELPMVVVEAWIIRKMKKETTLLSSDLFYQLEQQFDKIPIKTFKTILDNLIDRDFIIRNTDTQSLTYVP